MTEIDNKHNAIGLLNEDISIESYLTDNKPIRNRKPIINWLPFEIIFYKLSEKEGSVLKLHSSEFRASTTNNYINKLLNLIEIEGKKLSKQETTDYKSNFQIGRRPKYRGKALSLKNGKLKVCNVDFHGLTYIYMKKKLPEKVRIALKNKALSKK